MPPLLYAFVNTNDLPKISPQPDYKTVAHKAQGIDEVSFEIFFKEHFASLCTYCQFKFGFDLEVAKDAAHSAFTKFWENRSIITGGTSAKAYLFTIVNNICLDVLRHNQVRRKHEIYTLQNSSEVDDSPLSAEYKQLQNDIHAAVAELPGQMRKVFELSRHDGLRYAEIATELCISVKTVETQMGRALAKLRVKLSKYLVSAVVFCFLYFLLF